MVAMTETEAKTKLCHQATTFAASQQLANGSCVASDCMAWRWAEAEFAFEATERCGSSLENPPMPDGDGWVEHDLAHGVVTSGRHVGETYRVWTWRRAVSGRRGYCGLAGKVSP